ncbi:MAG TPA: arylsulfatase [Bacteroidetes bacterium]|nr:arylsulfatase [Bacteroidota bacterium]
MKNKFVLSSAALLFPGVCLAEAPEKKSLPNIVVIFIDDMGYGDVGCFGATGYETPNIDRMAGQGMRFTSFYSGSAVSSPSRAALLTGCFPPRIGITDVLMPDARIGLSPDETIIPEVLTQKGYVSAIIGKWHLGDAGKFMPLQQGFDEYFGLPYSNDLWPVHYNGKPVTRDNYLKEWKLHCKPLRLFEGNEPVDVIENLQDQDQLTTRYTRRAVEFIRKNWDKPFFLYVSHNMGHVPLGVSDKFRGKSSQGLYGDVMMEIDWSVGEIMKALKENGMENNTLVIFTSDNGPWLNYGNHAGSAGGLREGKNTVFEGGFRVSCIMKWPAVIPAGTVCNKMASSIDLLPTFAAITGASLPERPIDGVNILPLMKGDLEAEPRQVYFFYTDRALNAVRKGNWKLVLPHTFYSNKGSIVGSEGWPGVMNMTHTRGGLYDMRRDPGEWYDMSEVYPEVVKELTELADSISLKLGDSLSDRYGEECRSPGRLE